MEEVDKDEEEEKDDDNDGDSDDDKLTGRLTMRDGEHARMTGLACGESMLLTPSIRHQPLRPHARWSREEPPSCIQGPARHTKKAESAT